MKWTTDKINRLMQALNWAYWEWVPGPESNEILVHKTDQTGNAEYGWDRLSLRELDILQQTVQS